MPEFFLALMRFGELTAKGSIPSCKSQMCELPPALTRKKGNRKGIAKESLHDDTCNRKERTSYFEQLRQGSIP